MNFFKLSNTFRWTLALPVGLFVAMIVDDYVAYLLPEPHVWVDYLAEEICIPSLIIFPIIVLVTSILVAPLHGKRFCFLTNAIPIIGTITFLVSSIFPPWVHTFNGTHANYDFILTSKDNIKLDFTRLFVEWICIIGITGFFWFLAATLGKAIGQSCEAKTTETKSPSAKIDSDSVTRPSPENASKSGHSIKAEAALAPIKNEPKKITPEITDGLTVWEFTSVVLGGFIGLLGLVFVWPMAAGFKSKGFPIKAKRTWKVYWLVFGIKWILMLIAILAVIVMAHINARR